jgi:phage terminase large subunit-like protein
MGLSNTAVPTYYGQFRAAVLRGEIPVNQEISMEMNRIDALIANPNIYYDDQAIEGFIRYCDNELTTAEGDDLTLLPTFKLWAESLLSWYYFINRQVYVPYSEGHGGRYVDKTIKKRLIRKQYLIVARGAAKSMYLSCLQSYFLNCEKETTQQITTAPTMKQAEEVLSPIRTSITRARGPLFKFLTEGSLSNTTGSRFLRQKLASTKKGIENFFTNSSIEIRPMSVDKLQGLRPKVATIDEWLSGDVREDVVAALEQGASKNPEYVIVAVSSEGTVRNGVGDSIKMELTKILRGDFTAPHVSIWHYKLDDIEEINDPSMWLKANPNLGATVEYEVYHLDVARAEEVPSQRNDIVAKRFGIPLEGFTYFFTYDEIQPSIGENNFWQMQCAMGADLSQGDDFCAFTFLFPLVTGEFGIITRSYITKLTLDRLPIALRAKYEEFVNEGSLYVFDNVTILDMMDVYDDLDRFIIQNGYVVQAMGYDPYNAEKFVQRWIAENSPFGVEKVIQGARTESVPLGELKILARERMLLFYQGLMTWTLGNAVSKEDLNGNRMLVKQKNEEKVDNVSALMDAYVAYKANKEAFA